MGEANICFALMDVVDVFVAQLGEGVYCVYGNRCAKNIDWA
jgi:hypothetical protein